MTAPTANDNRPLADMTLFDTDTLKCPYHYDKTLRDEVPVYGEEVLRREKDPKLGVKWVPNGIALWHSRHYQNSVQMPHVITNSHIAPPFLRSARSPRPSRPSGSGGPKCPILSFTREIISHHCFKGCQKILEAVSAENTSRGVGNISDTL